MIFDVDDFKKSFRRRHTVKKLCAFLFFNKRGSSMKKQIKQENSNVQSFPQSNNRKKLRIDDLNVFEPLTDNQKIFFNLYNKKEKAFMLYGCAGTGKTFIALYKALEEVMDKGNSLERVIIVRSAVPSRDIGHLPGDKNEKTEVYLEPYKNICEVLFNMPQAYDRLAEQKNVEFLITSYVRGITLEDCVIIVDECQNMNFQELSSIITRVGENTKIIFCGDFRQTDLNKKQDQSGMKDFMHILSKMKSVKKIEFTVDDIVRSSFVKEFLMAQMEIGY